MNKLRVLIADDERPAREFLREMLGDMEDVEVIAQAENGASALELIRRAKPDLALLDLQMPSMTGLEVVRSLKKNEMPLVAFVTAFDDHAVSAFELNAVDYLLKPVEKKRLRETIIRATERIEREDWRSVEADKIQNAAVVYESSTQTQFIDRIPVKVREEIILVPVEEIASITADGELLNIRTKENQRYTINYRLKDIEQRLDPKHFIRLSRSAVINLDEIVRIAPLPGGTYLVNLKNGQELTSSRMQSKVLRGTLLKI